VREKLPNRSSTLETGVETWKARKLVARWLERSSAWALAALLATLPFWRHRVLLHRPGAPVFFEFHHVVVYTTDLFWCASLGAWLLSRLVDTASARLRRGPWFVFGPLLGLLLFSAAGIPLAVDPLYAAYQTGRLVLLLALYLMLVNMRPAPPAVAYPLALGIVLQAVVALPQFTLGRTLGLRTLGEVSANAAWPGSSVVKVGPESWLRAYGFAQHPNLLGGCLMAMLLVVAGHYLAQQGWKRLPLLVVLGAGCLALLLTFSRAAWLGTILGSAVAAMLLRHGRGLQAGPMSRSAAALLSVVALVAIAFVALNGPLLQSRFGLTVEATEIDSLQARKTQVLPALTLIRMRPLLGIGLGNYATALYALVPDMVEAGRVYQPVFFVPLLVTAELGVAGGLLWLWLIAAPWPELRRRCREGPVSYWWAGLSGALLALAVVSFFDFYVWTSHQGPLLLWIVLGLWAAEWEEARRHCPVAGRSEAVAGPGSRRGPDRGNSRSDTGNGQDAHPPGDAKTVRSAAR
jgi:O-antigen ligase